MRFLSPGEEIVPKLGIFILDTENVLVMGICIPYVR